MTEFESPYTELCYEIYDAPTPGEDEMQPDVSYCLDHCQKYGYEKTEYNYFDGKPMFYNSVNNVMLNTTDMKAFIEEQREQEFPF